MNKTRFDKEFVEEYLEKFPSRGRKMSKQAVCPSCAIKVDIGQKPRFSQRIICPDCEAVLEIIQINPPLLDWAFEDGQDYYDGGDYLLDEISYKRRH